MDSCVEVYLQIIAFSGFTKFAFPLGPQKLTSLNKQKALDFIDGLKAYGQTNPWRGICHSLKNQNVGQLILLTDGIPTVSSRGGCNGESGDYIDNILNHNNNIRSKTKQGSLVIDTISLYHNYCDPKRNKDKNNWLSRLSSSDESECNYVE